MADTKTYIVNRSMHGEGRYYARGDTRKLTEADAASLLASGALSEQGKEPVTREPAVRHTFGTEPSRVTERGYTTPTGDGVIAGVPAVEQTVALPDVSPAPAASPAPSKARR